MNSAEHHGPGAGDDLTAPGPGPGQLMFTVVRQWYRRWDDAMAGMDLSSRHSVAVAGAMSALEDRDEITVNDIAAVLGIDKSVASRMVVGAVAAGAVMVRTSPHDARRKALEVTEAGRETLRAARLRQESLFAHATQDWTVDERAEATRVLERLARLGRSHGATR